MSRQRYQTTNIKTSKSPKYQSGILHCFDISIYYPDISHRIERSLGKEVGWIYYTLNIKYQSYI